MTTADFWQRTDGFWYRGGFWKAVLLAGVWLTIFLGIEWLIGTSFRDSLDKGGALASAHNVLVLLLIPEIIGAVLIVVFLAVIGFLRPVFGRQPVTGRWWMWIPVVVVLYPAVLRFIGIPYSEYKPGVVPLVLLLGLFVGIAEELVTRGAAVALLRKRGYSELVVAVLSSTIFAAMHTANAVGSGISLQIGVLVVYTFCFGVCMYLVMRVTGSIVWAILAHAITDPTLFLATGGIDQTTSAVTQNPFLEIAGSGNLVVIVVGLVSLFFIRGRVQEPALTS